MKKWLALAAGLLLLCCAGCGKRGPDSEPEEDKRIVVGFSQLGAESDWRSANTASMKEAFSGNGYELIFEDGQQKQSNQITALRKFIQQDVDYIVLAPVTETGWDTVLEEVKEAGIPVIIVDRMVDVPDDSLFTCRVGSDFELEGKKAAEWLNRFAAESGLGPEEIHIVNLQGTIGASAQIGRTRGLEMAAEEHGWDLLEEAAAEFTQARGREVMTSLLAKYDNLNVVWCENDNEALGAMEAIEAAGKKAGTDLRGGEILVLSFDGVRKEALELVLEGKIACIAECNPHHGPRVRDIIESLESGGHPDKVMYVDEEIYSADERITELTVSGKTYPVTILTEESLEES